MADFTFVERKPMDGREVALDADATIGREGCDVVLADPEVSRRHAALRITDAGPAVEDFGSTNGTFVNDQRVNGVVQLKGGDVVRFGNTEWELRPGAAAAPPASVAAPQVTAARPVPTAAQAAPPAPAAAAPAEAPAQAAATPAEPAGAPGFPGQGRRGDVPAPPDITPSAIHRTLPPEAAAAPPAFAPAGAKQQRGSAATRAGYTAFCMAVFLLALAGLIVYFIVN
jgi:predicted component of type VI protein secretion system